MRFIPIRKVNGHLIQCLAFAVYSVLMTYFGVNYLLSGLHSYTAGDKVEIPMSSLDICRNRSNHSCFRFEIRNKKYKI